MASGHFSDTEWREISDRLPIACVDVLPVVHDGEGRIAKVGLILRGSPFGKVWCHVGGRLLIDETLAEAARRELDAVDPSGAGALPRRPFMVNEYFRELRPGLGHDPRKHAVAACFVATYPDDRPLTVTGEADDFAWYRTDDLPGDLWPGTGQMVAQAAGEPGWREEQAVYSAVNDRHVSSNGLMWQTPVLAMTAMAFLLTIALGGGAEWRRALAAALSAVVAVASVQLMARHSSLELRDAELLWEMERVHGMRPVHAPPSSRRALGARRGGGGPVNLLASFRSRNVWMAAMASFAVVSVVVAVLAVFGL
ncbi:NUDIX hydrolase family protein [Antribacter sp. KLBMP9083]|uniref:NUDIX hydrolase family protein n=1 Tax=Antribacter soli TaxID=2910976 RepID=A0AA41U9Q0_9MICO|nr:DUF4916 domain-containing protein [Antribacter soli]MCF4121847.1 NUDIX hydrolase family protein [Antribacter soli]